MRNSPIEHHKPSPGPATLLTDQRWSPRSFGYHLHKQAVLRLAACVESNALERERWFTRDAIAAFEGRTAEEVLIDGEKDALLAFLTRVIRLDRIQGFR